ncbi:carbonic anhydrase [Arenimonas maotaiensis]|uniref:Carbonic anhydrase n=1 Tax=Arenimonas maotaiensis TaxID=1446479 RepID=A0A917FH12_9GAMM|nr:carbonic anhydrase [Arenimonas maotaiensis]GGF82276.1 carbonic anhydrase [Arenimonas maotaiensis]
MPKSGIEALEKLREGNRRFVDHVISLEALLSHARRAEHAKAQEPFAVILGCSDSRAPAEFIFDQGLGDLFVIRVAGNIAAPSQIGSVEFAVERFGVRLVVVLGHSNCGAVQATLDAIDCPGDVSPALHAIVDRIMPSLTDTPLLEKGDCPERTQYAVRANVRHTMQRLIQDSDFINRMRKEKGLLIVGADYSLDTGEVDFFETPPAQ